MAPAPSLERPDLPEAVPGVNSCHALNPGFLLVGSAPPDAAPSGLWPWDSPLEPLSMTPQKAILAVAVALLLCSACKGSGGGSEGAVGKSEPVVAQVGDETITAREFQAKLEEQPPLIRSRFTSLEAKKEFLDNLIRFEVLVQEARRQGLDKDAEIKDALEKLMVQKLIQKHSESASTQPLTDEELRKYYQEHQSEFVRPEKVRVSQVFLASAASDPKRDVVKAEADKLLANVRREEAGPVKVAFAELARSRSDDVESRAAAGDLGLQTREELTTKWGQAVADAAFGLKSLGDMNLVVSERGVHLLKLTGRQPDLEQTLEQVKPRLESRLLLEKRARAVDDLLATLKGKTKIEIDSQTLGGVSVQADGVGSSQPAP